MSIENQAGGLEVVADAKGIWLWDPTSTAHPDGISVVCPLSCRTYNSYEANFTNGQAHPLLDSKIILGTLNLEGADPDHSASDWELHGHTWHMEPLRPGNLPLIDHKAGTVWSYVTDSFTVSYQYASQPGRWIRQWGPDDPVCISMLSDDQLVDHTDRIRWCVNLAHSLNRDICIDGHYYYSGVIELYSGQTIYGTRGAKLEVRSADVIEKYRIDVGNSNSINGCASWFENALQTTRPYLLPKPHGTNYTIRDLELYGAADLVDWMWVRDSGSFDPTELAHQFQDAPQWGAWAFTTHGGRPNNNPKLTIRNCHIHDYASAMLLMDGTVDIDGLKAGNVVGNRAIYRCRGVIRNLETYGWCRFNPVRHNHPIRIENWKHTSNQAGHPWPEITFTNVAVCEGENTQGWNDSREQYTAILDGIDIDVTGFADGLSLSAETYVRGIIRNAVGAWRINDKIEGAISQIHADVVLDNAGTPSLSWPWTNAQANVRDFQIRCVDRTPAIAPPGVGRHWGLFVARNPSHSANHAQQISVRHSSDHPLKSLVHISDVSTRTGYTDTIPTTFDLSGSFNNTRASLVHFRPGIDEQGPTPIVGSVPVRINLHDALINMIAPGGLALNNYYPEQFKVLSMARVRTRDGMVSEQQGELQGVVDSDEITLVTDLLWTPKQVQIVPLSANAARFFRGIEWEVLNPGAVNEDARRPKLRVRLCHELDAAEALDVKYQWSAAVSP